MRLRKIFREVCGTPGGTPVFVSVSRCFYVEMARKQRLDLHMLTLGLGGIPSASTTADSCRQGQRPSGPAARQARSHGFARSRIDRGAASPVCFKRGVKSCWQRWRLSLSRWRGAPALMAEFRRVASPIVCCNTGASRVYGIDVG